ncbi:hypothetical protein FSARC_10078 [Fusarium sarcochroum]|uniref:RanBP2-type domain-containing protein n=1 Tax=Fusarium sarcochroum TaxID=1208366 RepID=A0A8H4TQ21_9HYPO|nr:hypothetical protein FSARC_10078 [Fusarium sarcochroum]
MSEQLTLWAPATRVTRKVWLDDLSISFQRTVRVPDNDDSNDLPPDLGSFPLHKVDDYADKLPVNMAEKGGIFIPMYQREAMWIKFQSKKKYAIKIFVGGINAVSGEPAVPNAATALRRRNILKQGRSIQDYIVVPEQEWLDGVAVEAGNVRQFVAVPFGTGYSVEAQMTGEEVTAGIQFEITRLDTKQKDRINFLLTDCNNQIKFSASPNVNIRRILGAYREYTGAPFNNHYRVPHNGERVQDGNTIAEENIPENATLVVQRECVGGGPGPISMEMTVGAGGHITQGITKHPENIYVKTVTATFNVQILNCTSFEQVTGKAPPKSPVTAKTYAQYGYPFFSLYEEPTNVSGDFSALRSVAQIDQAPDESLPNIPVVDVETRHILLDWTCHNCGQMNRPAVQKCDDCLEVRPMRVRPGEVGLFNPQGPKAPFKLTWEVVQEVGQMRTAL